MTVVDCYEEALGGAQEEGPSERRTFVGSIAVGQIGREIN